VPPPHAAVATEATTICRAFQATARAHADKPALRSLDGAIDWTWREYADAVGDAAAGLAGLGLTRGETLACWVSNRPEFQVTDAAAIHLGAASVSLSPASTIEHAERLVADSGAKILVADDLTIDRALSIRARGTTRLGSIVAVDESPTASVISWPELLGCADETFDLPTAMEKVAPDDVATVIYPSGPAAARGGIRIAQRRVMERLAALSARLELRDGIAVVARRPMTGLAERLCTHYLAIMHGWSVTTCAPARITPLVIGRLPSIVAQGDPMPGPAEILEFWRDLGAAPDDAWR
jgi:long-subunit acyl-CoA synthetase (AMP-forming)